MTMFSLHDIRSQAAGASKLHKELNPFIHVTTNEPLVRILYTITRPTARVKRGKIVAPPPTAPTVPSKARLSGSVVPQKAMVSYRRERWGTEPELGPLPRTFTALPAPPKPAPPKPPAQNQ